MGHDSILMVPGIHSACPGSWNSIGDVDGVEDLVARGALLRFIQLSLLCIYILQPRHPNRGGAIAFALAFLHPNSTLKRTV